MTSRTLLLPVLLSFALFYACGKGDSTSTLTGKYIRSKTLLVDDLVLYTKSGAYRDTNMIKDFVARNFRAFADAFYYGQTTVTDHSFYASLEFFGDNKVKLNGQLAEIVSKSDTEMMLALLDSTEMPNNTLGPLVECSILHEQVPQYNPYSLCRAAGGNCNKFRRICPVIISGNDYYIPQITYVLRTRNCSIATHTSTSWPNYFNKEILNGMLQNNDSVLVQISRLPLVK